MKTKLLKLCVLTFGLIVGVSSLSVASSKRNYGTSSRSYDHGYRSSSKVLSTTDSYPAAIKKYDPIMYFKEGKAVKGKSDRYFIWQGKKWHFVNSENEREFTKNPEQYAPQYGGYCAYAVSQGSIAKSDPKVWSVVEDKLYLNINKSVQRRWEGNKSQYIKAADKNWPRLEQNLP